MVVVEMATVYLKCNLSIAYSELKRLNKYSILGWNEYVSEQLSTSF